MPSRNPLRESDQPRELKKGDKVINQKTIRKIIIPGQNGNVEFTLSESDSRPDANGDFIDTESSHLNIDPSGRVIPQDAEKIRAFTYSGAPLYPEDQFVECVSPFHRGANRLIRLGYDGHLSFVGPLCHRCRAPVYMVSAGIGLVVLSILVGVYRGLGWF